MIKYKDLLGDIYFSSSILMRKFLKLINQKKNIDEKSLLKEYIKIYNGFISLKVKNNKQTEFKNYCISFIKGTIEKDFPYSFIDKENINNENKEKNENIINYKDSIFEKQKDYNKRKIELYKKEKIEKIHYDLDKDNKNLYECDYNNNKKEENIDKYYLKNNEFNLNGKNEETKINLYINNPSTLNNNQKDVINQKIGLKRYEQKIELKKYNQKIESIESVINELISNKINIKIMKEITKILKNKSQNEINYIFQKLQTLIINLNSINKLQISQRFINKSITLICAFFPFFNDNQKEQLLKINFGDKIINNLKNNLLLYNKEDNKIMNLCDIILLSSKDINEKNEILKEIINIIINPPFLKINIFYAYQLILLYKIIYKKDDRLSRIKLLAFKIQFILHNYTFFSINLDEFINIYNNILLMNNFYTTIYENEIKEPYIIKFDNINNKIIYGNKKYYFADIEKLFNENENEIYKKMMDNNNGVICHFYNINNSNFIDLINYSSFYIRQYKNNFLDNIFSLINIKNCYIKKNFVKYKKNLINLEKEIFDRGKQCLTNNKTNNIIYRYSRKTEYEKIFFKFSKKLNSNIDNEYKNKYKIFPFGSVTEFLSEEESDLDIYLYLEDLNNNEKVKLLNHIYKKCQILFDKVKKIISTRICLIKLVFEGTDIDLSITGFCPYIHSLLFKEYGLIDPRFPLLAITLKHFSKITNLTKDNYYLNSFSWTTLLITFLQDIIQPPILPKLFSEKEINDKIKKIIKFGNGKGIDKNNKNTEKNFSQFFESLKEEIIHIPDCLINKDKTKKIYIKFNKNNENNKVEKNNLTCAEILLKFLEFIAYYFKYDTLYVRCSLENEGFFNMSEIENIYNNDDEKEKVEENIIQEKESEPTKIQEEIQPAQTEPLPDFSDLSPNIYGNNK